MIKLTNILNELSVNNPVVTPEKVFNYYVSDIYNNINYSLIIEDYAVLCKPYCEKYDILVLISDIREFERLSQSDLNSLYNKMRQLVQKYNK